MTLHFHFVSLLYPVLLSFSLYLSLSCVISSPLTISLIPPSCSAEALGHHPTALANPCISFPIPIPAGLWHGGDEGTFPLWLYIWFNGMIIGAVCVCARVCRWRRWWCWEWERRPWPHPGDNGHICALSLYTHTWMCGCVFHPPKSMLADDCAYTHACMAHTHTHRYTHRYTPLHLLALRLGAVDGRHGDWFLVKCQWRWKYYPKASLFFSLSLCLPHTYFSQLIILKARNTITQYNTNPYFGRILWWLSHSGSGWQIHLCCPFSFSSTANTWKFVIFLAIYPFLRYFCEDNFSLY